MTSDEPAGDTAPGVGIDWWEPGFRSRAVFDAVFILVGLGYLGAALNLGTGTLKQPGAGAFPVFAGALLVLTLAADLLKLLVTGALRNAGSGRVPLKIMLVIGSLAIYLIGVELLGHAITGTVVFAFLLFVLGSRSWWKIAIIAIVAGFGSDAVFTALLGLDLPTGVIEFGVDEWI